MATKQEKLDRGDLVDDDELENEDLENEDLDEDEKDLDEDEKDLEDSEDEDEEDSEDEDDEDLEDDNDDEEDDDEDDEDSEDDDEDDEEDSSDEEDDQRIPRSRLNQVIKQRDEEKEKRNEEKQRTLWLEDQLEKLIENQTIKEIKEVEKVALYDFNQAETEYIELLLEGETQKAISKRNDIENARKTEWEQKFGEDTKEIKRVAKEEAQESIEEDRFDSLIENYENKYAFLDIDSNDYNEEAVETVNTLMMGYQTGGDSKSQSLKKAVLKVAPMFEETKPKIPKKKGLGNRTKTARKRNVRASKQQPPKSKGKKQTSRDLDELNVGKMDEKEFRNLSVKERKILRGD